MTKKFLNLKLYLKPVCRQAGLKPGINFFDKEINAGFSMIELLVTIAILALVSGLVFFNHSQFNSNVLIGNLAYEISLAIRQAQSYGVQVKEVGGSFDEGYGIYFSSTSDEFIIFADTYPTASPNFVYNSGTNSDTVIDILKMTNGNQIEDLCVTLNAVENCTVNNISISFLRPDPTAIITANSVGTVEYNSAMIKIISPKGDGKQIYINRVGQISVQ